MKVLGTFIVLAAVAVFLRNHPPKTNPPQTPEQIEAVKQTQEVNARAEARRHLPTLAEFEFNGEILQVIPGGKALANGSFRDVSSAKESMYSEDVFLSGLPAGLYDRVSWRGGVRAGGTQTFTTALGTYRTLPAYQVATLPATPAPKAGDWLKRNGRTALDHPAHR